MSESAIDEIEAANDRRHNHWTGQTDRCPYCGSFVSLEDIGSTRKGICSNCGKAILRYRNHAPAATD